VVVSFDFGTTKLDGVSTFTNSRTPVIFLNSALPPSRRKFTLVHELAHIVMHRMPRPNAEEEAHHFAAEFLMPEADIARELKPVTLEHLEQLKLKWGVAMAALLKRAETLGLITRNEATNRWIELSRRGFRKHEPHEEFMPPEEPSRERELVRKHLNELGFTRAGVLELLDLSQSELDEILREQDNNLNTLN
jgi:Zn-dependent peptidase ImmA (M78 family)